MTGAPIAEALALLGIDQLVCAVHDRSLPVHVDDDVGCGSPAGRGAADFLAFLAEQGFTGVLLGPPGRIERGNLSPYDGAVFSRSALQLDWRSLADGVVVADDGDGGRRRVSVLDPADVDAVTLPADRAPERCDYRHAFDATDALLAKLHARWDALDDDGDAGAVALSRAVAAYRAENEWVDDDGVYLALAARYGEVDAARWPDTRDRKLNARGTPAATREARRAEIHARHGAQLVRHAREQWLLATQHAQLRERAHEHGLVVVGDLHVGFSPGDRWSQASIFLEGWALGAPPSRTNPLGQPWRYPVFDPAQLGGSSAVGSTGSSAAIDYVRRRARKLFAEYDGIRIDHPHGLVCPWVYRVPAGNDVDTALAAVRDGARLYSVGGAAGHEGVAVFDIARPTQIKAEASRWADDFVRELDADQVNRYGVVFDALVDEGARAGVAASRMACEVLSTLPHPLACVIARHGLGRFRVTSKANVEKRDDVYLPAMARPEDWIMVATHDTPPIWSLAQRFSDDVAAARAAHAAGRLSPPGAAREALTAELTASRSHLACAELAVLFTSRARNVMVFVSDLMGEERSYNIAGVVNDENWTLRVPHHFRAVHDARARKGQAFDVSWALALAVSARFGAAQQPLVDRLKALAKSPLPGSESGRP